MKVRKKQCKPHDNRGFSLIEVLLAIVILALISAPILRGFIITANTSAKSRVILEATDVAQLVVEEVSAMSYDGDVTDTFLTDDDVTRLASVSYSAPGASVSHITVGASSEGATDLNEKFISYVATHIGTDKKCYRCNSTVYGQMVAVPNVEYDGKTYDVMLYFKPNTGEGTTYYTYDVSVEVYKQVSTTTIAPDDSVTVTVSHYDSLLVKFDTQITNKY